MQGQSFDPFTEHLVYAFQPENDGAFQPTGGVVFDKKGNLYGATLHGGTGGTDCIGSSCGTIYQLAPTGELNGSWTESVLYSFTGKDFNDGQLPNGGLIIDSSGNIYGVTAYGGSGNCTLLGGLVGCGTVFELSPPVEPGGVWTETILYNFQSGNDGYLPNGNLVFDEAGNLYGATMFGGGFGTCDAPFYPNCGTVFELSPPPVKGGPWTENALYSFRGGTDGANPNGGLALDREGLIYGTTPLGGSSLCNSDSGPGCGTVFQLTPATATEGKWTERLLHIFRDNVATAPNDGSGPSGGVIFDDLGNLYGTTAGGGLYGDGTVFQIERPRAFERTWNEIIIRTFGAPGSGDGFSPQTPLTSDLHGGFYGTTLGGGAYSGGTVFRLCSTDDSRRTWNFTVTYALNALDGQNPVQPISSVTLFRASEFGAAMNFGTSSQGAVYRIGP